MKRGGEGDEGEEEKMASVPNWCSRCALTVPLIVFSFLYYVKEAVGKGAISQFQLPSGLAVLSDPPTSPLLVLAFPCVLPVKLALPSHSIIIKSIIIVTNHY